MVGYGRNPPDPRWPGGARIAVQFVLNYEEGGENCILHGDAASEAFLSEIVGAQPLQGVRNMNMESIYEYGSRAGFWRLWRHVRRARHAAHRLCRGAWRWSAIREAAAAMKEAGWEIASHGLRWIDYQYIDIDDERRQHGRRRSASTREVTGERPLGWYTGRTSPNTPRAGRRGGSVSLCRRLAMPTTCPIGWTSAASGS